MDHNDYRTFMDLPDDAQNAFTMAIRWYRREFGDPSAWSDIARQSWIDKMRTARPGVTGWTRAKGLVVGARLVVCQIAKMWAEAQKPSTPTEKT
jgi:hypothetical protein